MLSLCVDVFYLPSITFTLKKFSKTEKVPINITVNGTLTISDANNDASGGKNPNLTVNLTLTPDLGGPAAIGAANFRIRTNRSSWKLTAQRTTENDNGPTNILAMDVIVGISTMVGLNANPNAGVLVAPFNAATDLSQVSTSVPVTVIEGKSKTSTQRDSTNLNNFFEVNTVYGIASDFYYQPGTWSTTITYSLVSP